MPKKTNPIKELIPLSELLSSPEAIDPITYQYYKCLENRIILINSTIDESIIELAIVPLMNMDNDESGKPITILLNTAGGSVYNGLLLCDVIEHLKTPTKLIALAYTHSMGSLIMFSGANNPNVKRYCYPFSISLIHSGSACFEGSATQVKDAYEFNQKYEERVKKFILSHSKISEKEYEQLERKEYCLDSEGMLRIGLVDEIY